MNPRFLGDSYDIVKRFFCHELSVLGYDVVAEPMFTGEWNVRSDGFFRLIGARPREGAASKSASSALFFDPDTGVNGKGGRRHVSFDTLATAASTYAIAFSFDQSFSRRLTCAEVMAKKLAEIRQRRCYAMYYSSHAHFIFVSARQAPLIMLRDHLVALGMPLSRLVTDVPVPGATAI